MDDGERPGPELHWRLSRHTRRLITLGLAGLAIALISGRPEFAGVAAPALLILGARRPDRPARVGVHVRLSTTRSHEGEHEAVEIRLSGVGEHDAELFFQTLDAAAHTGLREMKPRRSRDDGAGLNDRQKGLEVSRVHAYLV